MVESTNASELQGVLLATHSSEFQPLTLDEYKTVAPAQYDCVDLRKLCFVDGKPLRATAAQRELLSLYGQAMKMWIRGMHLAPPHWLTIVTCVICTTTYEEALWPGLAETGDYEGFHCTDPEHIARFHGVAPQTRNCCELSYHPDRPYAWRTSHVKKVEAISSTLTKVTLERITELESDEEPTDSNEP